MRLTAEQFIKNLRGGFQRIILLGPSGIGKTEWSRRLANQKTIYPRFTAIEMDKRIGNSSEMSELLTGVKGKNEAEKMGIFFGKPWEDPEDFSKKEKRYLQVEAIEMQKAYQETREKDQIVFDLTGSAIYCPRSLKTLAQTGLVIHLRTTPERYDEMKKTYLEDPKPVCWDVLLQEWQAGASVERLPELYTKLLRTRDRLYESFSDITLPWEVHRKLHTSTEFLDAIHQQLF